MNGHEISDNIYVPENVVRSLSGKALFYPCAGNDIEEPIHIFAPIIKEFWFCDLQYPRGLDLRPSLEQDSDYELVDRETWGHLGSVIKRRIDDKGREYRFIEPSVFRETYRHIPSGGQVVVNRRRGFGEYALKKEFPDRFIGIFIHRGDSPGEAGSNAYFLANRNRDHEPISRLFEKLSNKLCDSALVISDGSNCRIRHLKKYHHCNAVTGPEAFAQLEGKIFHKWEFRWECVGYLSNRYGPSLVWHVNRL